MNARTRGREATTSPGKLAARARFERALELRRQGVPYRAIAQRLGLKSAGAVYAGVMRLLREVTVEHAEALREIENERLDALQAAIWDKAMAGDLDAVDSCLRIILARARINGIEAAPKAPVDSAGNDARPQVTIVYEAFPGGPLLPAPPEGE